MNAIGWNENRVTFTYGSFFSIDLHDPLSFKNHITLLGFIVMWFLDTSRFHFHQWCCDMFCTHCRFCDQQKRLNLVSDILRRIFFLNYFHVSPWNICLRKHNFYPFNHTLGTQPQVCLQLLQFIRNPNSTNFTYRRIPSRRIYHRNSSQNHHRSEMVWRTEVTSSCRLNWPLPDH